MQGEGPSKPPPSLIDVHPRVRMAWGCLCMVGSDCRIGGPSAGGQRLRQRRAAGPLPAHQALGGRAASAALGVGLRVPRSGSLCSSHHHRPHCKLVSPSLAWNVHEGLSLSCLAVAVAVGAGPPGVGTSPERPWHLTSSYGRTRAGLGPESRVLFWKLPGLVSSLSLFVPWRRPQGP